MALPKITSLTYKLHMPIANIDVTFRPYTVKDEKILLAAESVRETDPAFYVENTTNVIKNCLMEDAIKLPKLASVEVEYLLLHLRGKSVGENIRVSYKKDGKVIEANLPVDSFKIHVPENHKYEIKLTDDIVMILRDLSFEDRMRITAKYAKAPNKTDMIYDSIVSCVYQIVNGDEVFTAGQNVKRSEIEEFVMDLSGHSTELYEFIQTMPTIHAVIQTDEGDEIEVSSDEIDFLA